MAKNRKKKAAQAAAAAQQGGLGAGIKGLLKSPAVRGVGGSIAGFMALEQLLGTYNRGADREVQSEAIQMQAEAASPESLYQQAALPQARQEEDMARQMLLQQLSGGVTGPSVGRGERLIGRR